MRLQDISVKQYGDRTLPHIHTIFSYPLSWVLRHEFELPTSPPHVEFALTKLHPLSQVVALSLALLIDQCSLRDIAATYLRNLSRHLRRICGFRDYLLNSSDFIWGYYL